MIKSMTAYANREATIGPWTVYCELRSVNHRYCDVTVKLPERLRYAEAPLRALLAEQLKRGKVECLFNCKRRTQDGEGVTVDMPAVTSLLAAVRQIEALMSAPASFSALDVLAFPGVQQEPDIDKDEIAASLAQLLNDTLTGFMQVREREGRQLSGLIDERCQKMQALVESARMRAPEVLLAIHKKLQDRIGELVAQPDSDRLEQELVLSAQKLDIAEELDRLATHIVEVRRVLQQSEPVGRRLDFLMQELNREANTLGSKSADKDMTQIAIELKVLIEQMREQVQNIE